MWLQGIAEQKRSNSDGRRGCPVGQREMAGDSLVWNTGRFSTGHSRNVQEKNRDDGATERRNGRRKKPFFGR
jgi:hypothetical protein